jgi:catechol 2,3-dioxygenase-like lactoylglutathione lyase family enzyme
VETIDHLDLVVSDFERSLGFYRGLLGPLGYGGESPIEGERGEHVVYLGKDWRGGSLSLRQASPTPTPSRTTATPSASTTSPSRRRRARSSTNGLPGCAATP